MINRYRYSLRYCGLATIYMVAALHGNVVLGSKAEASGIKQDIRGIKIGMVKSEVRARYPKCVGSDELFSNLSFDFPLNAPPEYNQTALVCGPFSDGTILVVYFTAQISGGKVYGIEYKFGSNGRSSAELIDYISSEYGLTPSRRANCWQANSVEMDWLLGNSTCLGFDSNYKMAMLVMAQFSLKKDGRSIALERWRERIRSKPLPRL